MTDEVEAVEAAKPSPEAVAVAHKLGKISLGDWIAFAKMVIPTLAVALPILLMPVDAYLDKREAKFKGALMAEMGPSLDASIAQEKLHTIEKTIEQMRGDLKDLEGELKGDLRASPTAYENMAKIAEIRERLAGVEAQLGIERRRER